MGGLLNLSSRPVAGLLNRSVAGFDSLEPIDVDLFCNKNIYYVSISFIAFFMILFTNLMNASACPLLQWFYDDHTTYVMLGLLQRFLTFFWNKVSAHVWNYL